MRGWLTELWRQADQRYLLPIEEAALACFVDELDDRYAAAEAIERGESDLVSQVMTEVDPGLRDRLAPFAQLDELLRGSLRVSARSIVSDHPAKAVENFRPVGELLGSVDLLEEFGSIVSATCSAFDDHVGRGAPGRATLELALGTASRDESIQLRVESAARLDTHREALLDAMSRPLLAANLPPKIIREHVAVAGLALTAIRDGLLLNESRTIVSRLGRAIEIVSPNGLTDQAKAGFDGMIAHQALAEVHQAMPGHLDPAISLLGLEAPQPVGAR